MTSTRPVPRELAGGPFTRRAAIAHVSDHQLAGPAYQRLLRGVHAPADLPITHAERIRAVRAQLPRAAVLAGKSALWAFGVKLADPAEPVEVILPLADRVRTRAEVRVRGDQLRPDEIVSTRWGPVTSPARTGFDLGRRGGVRVSVPLLDALANRTGIEARQIERLAATHRGARGSRLLPAALDLLDAGAESVRESLLRLILVEAGLPRPVTQFAIRDRYGRFVARVDLSWPELRLALEYDGAHHDRAGQIAFDRQRMNSIHACGWSTLVIDRAQLRDEARVISLVRAMLDAALVNDPPAVRAAGS